MRRGRGRPGRPSGATRRAVTVTRSGVGRRRRRARRGCTRSPSSAAMPSASCWEPPAKRASCAPPVVRARLVRPPPACEIEEREQERQLARSGAEDGLDGDLDDGAGRRRTRSWRSSQVASVCGVERGGVGSLPGSVGAGRRGRRRSRSSMHGDAVGGAVGVRGGDEPDVGVCAALAQLDALRPSCRWGTCATPSSSASAARWSWVGPDPLAAAVDGEAGRA